MSLLEIEQLSIRNGEQMVLRELSLTLDAGDTVAIVGESGSGKTQAMLAILGLQAPQLQLSGSIFYDGESLLGADAATLRRIRGGQIGFAFQDALSSLNPYLSIGAQLIEVVQAHRGASRAAARAEAVRLLDAVCLSEAPRRLHQFAHELSGGMRQRVMLAMALAGGPRLLIADEPTSALDVTVQAQITALLAAVCREQQLALLLISHDLSVVQALCQRTLVLYAGEMMEMAATATLLTQPTHPYTRALLQARPSLHAPLQDHLPTIAGSLPRQRRAINACVFAPRCSEAFAACHQQRPQWQAQADAVRRCWKESASPQN